MVGKEVGINRITKDRYQRTVAELSIDGMNIQEYTSSTVGGYSFTKHFYQELKFNTTLQVTNNLSISNFPKRS